MSSIRISEKFSSQDADIVFQSADAVHFRIHKINLIACTEGLAPPETATFDDIVHLTEHSAVLELLFQFIYPIPQPDIQHMPFDDVAALTEAAEKYQVYPAMSRCRWYMLDALPDHALPIFAYATKHGYPDIMSKAAYLILDEPPEDVVRMTSPQFIGAWHRYYAVWKQASHDAAVRHRPGSISAHVAILVIDKILASLRSLHDLEFTFEPSMGITPSDRLTLASWKRSVEADINTVPDFESICSPSAPDHEDGPVSDILTQPMAPMAASPRYSAADAEIHLLSSDGISFHIHQLNVRACAANPSPFYPHAVLPPSHSPDADEAPELKPPVRVSEDSVVLEMLFQYIYPLRKPRISKASFEHLQQLAAAAEKYKIYSAMADCSIFMRKAVPQHPDIVLAYATKHQYNDLADQAAPLVINRPPQEIARILPVDALVPWIEYYEIWNEIARTSAKRYGALKKGSRHAYGVTVPTCASSRCDTPLANEMVRVLEKLGEGARGLKELDEIIWTHAFCCDARKDVVVKWKESVDEDMLGIPLFSTLL